MSTPRLLHTSATSNPPPSSAMLTHLPLNNATSTQHVPNIVMSTQRLPHNSATPYFFTEMFME